MFKTKEELQNSVVSAYRDSVKIFLLEWCTGLGKSFGALKLVQKISPKKVLLLVAEDAHKDNWKEEMYKFYNMFDYNIIRDTDLTIECYASLKNYENTQWDVIILDECHHISDLRREVLMSMTVSKVIALSATIESDKRYDLICNIFGDNRADNNNYASIVPLKDAIAWGLIPEPDIYLIPMELDNTISNQQIIESWGDKKKQKVIQCTYLDMWRYKKDKTTYPDVQLVISCTEFQKNQYYDDSIEYFKKLYMRNYQQFIYNKWMRLGNDRKRFLGELKTSQINKLLMQIRRAKKRFICFCTSIEQADILSNNQAIHSKNPDSNKLLELFQTKKRNELICVGKLTEGQNLVDIEVGIIGQLDGKERPFTQKHGRVLRSENPIQFIFYYKNTRDEEYLNKIMENVNLEYVQTVESLNKFII